jgi:hypothetical protein
LQVQNELRHGLDSFASLNQMRHDRSFWEALTSVEAFQLYYRSRMDSLNIKHPVSDLLGSTYDEDTIHQMEQMLWDLVQLEQNLVSALSDCKSLSLKDDIGPLLLINKGKEDIVILHELNKYAPSQQVIQEGMIQQEQLLTLLSKNYHQFQSFQEKSASHISATSLDQSLRDQLTNHEHQHTKLK